MLNKLPKTIPVSFFGCVLLASVSAYLFYYEFAKDPFLRGPDSYYYALQAEHWAHTGHVKIPDSSLLHRLTGILIKLGNSAENSVQMLWATLYGFLGLALSLMLRHAPARFALPLTAWFLFTPVTTYGLIEFPKMFSYLLPLALTLGLAAKKKRNLWVTLPLFLCIFLHKSSLPIVFLMLAIVSFPIVKDRLKFQWKRQLPIFTLILTMIALYVFFVTDRFHALDLARFNFQTQLKPGFLALLSRPALPLFLKSELILTISIIVCTMTFFIRTKNYQAAWLLASLTLPACIPFSVTESMSIGERYALLLPAFTLIFLCAYVPKKHRAPLTMTRFIASFAIIVAITTGIDRVNLAHPNYLDPQYSEYETITTQIKNYAIPMLIAHKGLNFFYKHKTKKEAFLYEPEDHWNKQHIWRLVYGIKASQFSHYLNEECAWGSGNLQTLQSRHYFLIREDCWYDFRSRITQKTDAQVYKSAWQSWLNPSKKRPAFLYRKHRHPLEDEGEFPAFAPEKPKQT